MGSTGNTEAVPRKSGLRSVTQGLGNDVWDILYNGSGQPHIPLRHSGTFPQYAVQDASPKARMSQEVMARFVGVPQLAVGAEVGILEGI